MKPPRPGSAEDASFPHPRLRRYVSSARRLAMTGCLVCFIAAFQAPPVFSQNPEPVSNGNVNLLNDGQIVMEQIGKLRAFREQEEREWVEEKQYLQALIQSVRAQKAELLARVNELSEIVERQETAWRRMHAQEQQAAEIEAVLAGELGQWRNRIRALALQASAELRNDLLVELDALDRREGASGKRSIVRGTREAVSMLDRLNAFQNATTRTVEYWNIDGDERSVVRVIYLGFGTAMYQVVATNETGLRLHRDGQWVKEPAEQMSTTFLAYWSALEEGAGQGVFNFPMQVPGK